MHSEPPHPAAEVGWGSQQEPRPTFGSGAHLLLCAPTLPGVGSLAPTTLGCPSFSQGPTGRMLTWKQSCCLLSRSRCSGCSLFFPSFLAPPVLLDTNSRAGARQQAMTGMKRRGSCFLGFEPFLGWSQTSLGLGPIQEQGCSV